MWAFGTGPTLYCDPTFTHSYTLSCTYSKPGIGGSLRCIDGDTICSSFTIAPSLRPTITPTTVTTLPTYYPTYAPSQVPSPNPTTFTENPTNLPSLIPSMSPTIQPTQNPTLITNVPTHAPTVNNSFNPTTFPTLPPGKFGGSTFITTRDNEFRNATLICDFDKGKVILFIVFVFSDY